MVRALVSFFALAAFGVFGWVVGSVYPAPDALVKAVNPQAREARAVSGLRAIDLQGLRKLLSAEQVEELNASAVSESAAAGQVIMVERVDEAAIAEAAPEAPPAPPAPVAANSGAFEASLTLCPGMTISNAPRADAMRKVLGYKPQVNVNGAKIAVFPTRGACLSSGFGPRGSRTHRGVDYHSPSGGPILAAGEGVIVEKKYRDDYGNMILIDHGNGVYTRYAHLSSFQRGLAVGAKVKPGDALGLMGNTASYAIPVHLHYEVLTGDYKTPKGSFGLQAVDPFTFPAAG